MPTTTFTQPTDILQYPVFAADQVLTSDDLNASFEYLDQQDRWSRIYLVGMGIVCGFELSVDLTQFTIAVSGGNGITSLGYLVFASPVSLAYYQSYTVPTTVNTADQYGPFQSSNTTGLFQLQSADYVSNLSTTDQAKWSTLTSGGLALLNGKRVVLYLELSEDPGMSCLTGNCDGPGTTMTVTLRYLLVGPQTSTGTVDALTVRKPVRVGAILSASELPDLYLPRFSVPSGALPDFTSIYNAYSTVFDTTTSGNTISQLSGALQNLYTFLSPVLTAYPTSPFGQVQTTLTNLLAGVQKNKPYAVQYFYDFLDDLIQAYREIQSRCLAWTGKCTPQINRFPLHLSLGLATQDTAGQVDSDRDYFIPSTLIAGDPHISEELRMLFDRINQMITTFVIPAYSVANTGVGTINLARQTNVAVKITPSFMGNIPLSLKAIPYYYPIKSTDPIQGDWNYALTSAGKSNENLGYNAGQYNVLPGGAPFATPLLYDILPYDFFRIEGHIGQSYTTVLNNLTTQINTYRLPFSVVALKLGTDASDITPSAASFDDLTSQYDVLISSLLCNLGTQVCFYGGQKYTATYYRGVLQKIGITYDAALEKNMSLTAYAATTTTASTTAVDALATKDFSNLATTGLLNTAVLNYANILPVNLRPIFLANIYTKGQFLSSQPCFKSMSQSDTTSATVGLTYMAQVNAGAAIPANSPTDMNSLSDYLLALLDQIDNVVADVFYVQLGYLNLADFTTKYQAMTSYASSIITLLNTPANTSSAPAGMVDYLTRLQSSCNLGQLTALCNDYQARYTALQQSMLFGNFVTANPAIDHRGGVPRGGTFLLVYYEKPAAATTTATATVASQITANIGDTSALKNIISNAATAKLATAKAATPRAVTMAAGASATKVATGATSQVAAAGASTSNISQLINLVQDKQYGFTAAQQSQILQVLNQKSSAPPTTDTGFNLPNLGVVADFFLPYLYNAQGGPITYVFPPSPAPPTDPVTQAQFVVNPQKFVYNDPNTYHFTVVPPLAQADILQQTSDPTKLSNPQGLTLVATATDVTMVPQASNVASTLSTTLSYENITQPLTIVKPLATFTLSLTQTDGAKGVPAPTAPAAPTDVSARFAARAVAAPVRASAPTDTATEAKTTATDATAGTKAAPTDTATEAKTPATDTGTKVAPTDTATEAKTTATDTGTKAAPTDTSTGTKATVTDTGTKAAPTDTSIATKTTAIDTGTKAAPTDTSTGTKATATDTAPGNTTAPAATATGTTAPPTTTPPTTTPPASTAPASTSSTDATAAPVPRMLNLAALDAGADTYAWTINGNTTLIPATASPSVNFDTLLTALKSPETLTISLVLTYTLNTVAASDTKTGVQNTQDLEAKLNSAAFQPTYNA